MNVNKTMNVTHFGFGEYAIVAPIQSESEMKHTVKKILLKVSTNAHTAKNNQTRPHQIQNNTQATTRGQQDEQKAGQYVPRDKLTKGLGVSLAKTPFELITPKAGTPSLFFFCFFVFLFCCVVASSQPTCHGLVMSLIVDLCSVHRM